MAPIIVFVTLNLVDFAFFAGMTAADAVAHIKEARPDLKRILIVNEVFWSDICCNHNARVFVFFLYSFTKFLLLGFRSCFIY